MKDQDATPFLDELKHLNHILKIIDMDLEEARTCWYYLKRKQFLEILVRF